MSDDDALSIGAFSWKEFIASLPQFGAKVPRKSKIYTLRYNLEPSFPFDVVVETVKNKAASNAFAKVPADRAVGIMAINEVDTQAIFVTMAPRTGLAFIHYKIPMVEDTYSLLAKLLVDPVRTHKELLNLAPLLGRTIDKLPVGTRFTRFNPDNYKPLSRNVTILQPTGEDLARYSITFELPVTQACCSCFRQMCEIRKDGSAITLIPVMGALTTYCPCPK
jgi:hypothetical protein